MFTENLKVCLDNSPPPPLSVNNDLNWVFFHHRTCSSSVHGGPFARAKNLSHPLHIFYQRGGKTKPSGCVVYSSRPSGQAVMAWEHEMVAGHVAHTLIKLFPAKTEY